MATVVFVRILCALFEEFDERIESIRKRQREAEELVEYLVALRKSDKDESHDYAEAQQELRQKLNVISLQTEHIRLKTGQDSRFLNLVKWCERISREVQRAASETVEGHVSRQALDQMFAMQRAITDHSAVSAAELGGQRIMIVDGRAVGAINRIPAENEARSNMHVGGRAEPCEITDRDHYICEKIGPTLKARGLLFVGIDVIGDYLTEINVTSPTGIREIERFSNVNIAELTWEIIEKNAAKLRAN